MKNRIQILKEIQKNQTYESIRFNNKHISDEHIKIAIDDFFPKIFAQDKYREIAFFIKAIKDEEFYKKIRTMVSVHLNLEMHLEEIQLRQNQKSKIQDSSEHGVQELNKKKMTRAALAKRNLQTQQQLRKDQIYVRLSPKTQFCLQWMLCNRNFPRIQCKLSCNQHIEYLVNYLSNKWLRGKGHYRIVLYPDGLSYLKNSFQAKQRQKIIKEPLNNYLMFTDIMVGSGIGQNGFLNLTYDILEKKKEGLRPVNPVNNTIENSRQGLDNNKREQISEVQKKVIILEEIQELSKRQGSLQKSAQKYQPVSHNSTFFKPPSQLLHENKAKGLIPQNKNNPNTQSLLSNHGNQQSNHFLSNQSNLLNPNKSIYHDDDSMFKSIGFFGHQANGNNSIGFTKKNDYNMISLNSNSYFDVEANHQKRQTFLNQSQQSRNKQESKNNDNKRIQNENNNFQNGYGIKIIKTQKKSIFSSPKKQSNSKCISEKQKQVSKSNQKSRGFSQIKQESNNNTIIHHQKLLDLRNAISLVEQVQGFKERPAVNPHPTDQMTQRSSLKQIKTVSIKKKTIN